MGITAGTQPLPARDCDGGKFSRALGGARYTAKPLGKRPGTEFRNRKLKSYIYYKTCKNV